MEIIFPSGEVNPPFQGQSNEILLIDFQELVDDLACSLQLLGVPKESRATKQIFVAGVLLSFVECQDVGVDGLLVNVSAPFMVENKRCGRCEGTLPPVLHLAEFSDCLGYAAFVEYTE